ncbi:MAG: CotS family spore coat protein [Caulobacteraceae bacterium]
MSSKYEKIKRHELKVIIEEEYGLRVKNMHEGDKGILIYTDNGVKRLKRAKSDDSKILFAASAYEHIYNNGFTGISCINRSLGGSYTVKYDKNTYMLQNFSKGKVYEIENEKDAAAVGRTLAKLHNAGAGFIPVPGSRARVDWGKWMEKFKAQSISMNKYMELVGQKPEKSRFDSVFLNNAKQFYERVFNCYLILRDNGYLDKVRQAMACNQIVHGEFKKHAIIRDDGGEVFITNLENCSYDICEYDIATLFESFSGKNRVSLVSAAAEAYSGIKPIDRDSLRIIEAFLICPRKFCNVIESCYGKKKNYNETELVNKLERSIRKEKRKEEVIAFLETC